MTVPAAEIPRAGIDYTFVDGRIAYARERRAYGEAWPRTGLRSARRRPLLLLGLALVVTASVRLAADSYEEAAEADGRRSRCGSGA